MRRQVVRKMMLLAPRALVAGLVHPLVLVESDHLGLEAPSDGIQKLCVPLLGQPPGSQ